MSARFHSRPSRAVPCGVGIEELEARALRSITAAAFSDNVLASSASQIALGPFVQDSDPSATLTFNLVATTTTDGGQLSISAASGLVTYTLAANSPSTDSFQYFATDTDSDSSATETVTLNLSSVAANPVAVNEVEGQSTISLTILNLPGAVQDASSNPSFTFSNAQVGLGGSGTVSFTDTKNGVLAYTPPGSTFTGDVTISYQISDGTGLSDSTVQIDIVPITADPVIWVLSRARPRQSLPPPFPAW